MCERERTYQSSRFCLAGLLLGGRLTLAKVEKLADALAQEKDSRAQGRGGELDNQKAGAGIDVAVSWALNDGKKKKELQPG